LIDRKEIKAKSKELLLREKHSPNIFLVTLVCVVIVAILGIIRDNLSDYILIYDTIFDGTGFSSISSIIRLITIRGVLFYIAAVLVVEMILLGFTIYTLKISRGETGSFWTLFEGFEHIVRYIILFILKTIMVSVGTIVFIFPGIILFVMFSQATFILLDNPETGPVECLAQSARMMKGYKADFFMLELSLLGWYVLIGVCSVFFGVFAMLIYIWLYPYSYLIFAHYYNELLAIKDSDEGSDTSNQ